LSVCWHRDGVQRVTHLVVDHECGRDGRVERDGGESAGDWWEQDNQNIVFRDSDCGVGNQGRFEDKLVPTCDERCDKRIDV